MKQFDAVILENRALAEDCYEMFLRWPEGVRTPFPGQIVTVHLGRVVPYLRRPFPLASYRSDGRVASVIYQVKGEATAAMAALRVGDVLDLLGPRGFYFQAAAVKTGMDPAEAARPLLVGAAHGAGALVFAASALAAKGHRPRLVLGFEHGSQVPRLDLAPEVEFVPCTEDGALGFAGTPAEYLTTLESEKSAFVWAAGPMELLKFIHEWSASRGLPCHVAVEQVIACGVGACQGCAVSTVRGLARVCTEGPVFSSGALVWT